jgi:hypothetical protein
LHLGGEHVPLRPQEIRQLVIAGWTGRDQDAVERHIAELEVLGVKRPSETPIFYRLSPSRATTSTHIQVIGTESSGEVEFVLLSAEDRLWVGLGSDHTDRAVETYDVAFSKQICDKPIATVFWDYEEVAPHWDDLQLRSYLVEADERELYQQGSVAEMLDPGTLLEKHAGDATLADGCLLFGGTLSTLGGLRYADVFEFEIEDPVLGRQISHRYTLECLPHCE